MDEGRILPDPSSPYGMRQGGLSYSNGVENKYLYNGKELQDDDLGGVSLDWYDYGARFYDASLGRFLTIDQLNEKYYFQTPYSYAINNPIKFIDYYGLAPYLLYYGNNSDFGTMYIYDDNGTPNDYSDDLEITFFEAKNQVIKSSNGKWEDGIYQMKDTHTPHMHGTKTYNKGLSRILEKQRKSPCAPARGAEICCFSGREGAPGR